MKINIPTTREVNATHIFLELPDRYDGEDLPHGFPLREGNMWRAKVELETGKIEGWPEGETGSVYMKVCDEGTYTLLDENGNEVSKIEQNYVPHGVVPGEYGDYVSLEINEQGVVTNWPKKLDFSSFFGPGD